ncbi:MAG: MurR/RpiR family transcriptional regulator [Desulfohalobiaceae bacterium]|nr:MurR/RpiR family transcriptional regulator [Desulfohalobiaceae bacterium]
MLEQLSEIYPDLTKSQKKLAAYVTEHIDRVLLFNSHDLARQVGVSEATVSRFVRRLGFASYLEFKRDLIRSTLDSYSTTRRLARYSDRIDKKEQIYQEVFASDIENIRLIQTENPGHVFEEVVKRLCVARCIYVLGLRSSFALAYHLSFNLHFFLRNVIRVEPGVGDLPEQLVEAGPDDVLVAISFKRYTRETITISEKIKELGPGIIGIVDNRLSPLAATADFLLTAGTRIPSYFESYTAAMSLINGLIAAVVLHKEPEAIPALEKLEKVFDRFQTFYPV